MGNPRKHFIIREVADLFVDEGLYRIMASIVEIRQTAVGPHKLYKNF